MPPYDGCPEVELTALPAEGWEFTEWSDEGCLGTACTVTAKDSPVTATFTITRHRLTVNIVNNGKVTSDFGNIDCPEFGCSDEYNWNEDVTLTAVADEHYKFSGWSGGGCSDINPCTVNVRAAIDVTATFELGDNVLRVLIEGNVDGARVWIKDPRGNFDDPPAKYCYDECIAIFEEGDTVVLKRKGGTYISWAGVVCEGSNNSNDTCVITMDGSSKTATANFAP